MELFEFDSDKEAIKALESEGRRLKYIALKAWRKYLSSYKPRVYVRTRKSQRGIKLGKVKKIGVDSYGIELTFVDDLMYHDSVINSREPKGHSIMLISNGWKVKKGKHRDIENFGYFEGIDYLGTVEKEFNRGKKKGVDLEIQWSGKTLK